MLVEVGITIVCRKSHTQSASQPYRTYRDALIKKGSRKATMKLIQKPEDYIIQNVRETILEGRHQPTVAHCWATIGRKPRLPEVMTCHISGWALCCLSCCRVCHNFSSQTIIRQSGTYSLSIISKMQGPLSEGVNHSLNFYIFSKITDWIN